VFTGTSYQPRLDGIRTVDMGGDVDGGRHGGMPGDGGETAVGKSPR
jgi:hypothetical protein